MTYTGGEYSLARLFEELKKQARNENVSSYSEYVDLVDNLIEEKKSYGFLADEEDLEQIRHGLESRWVEIEQNLVHA
jgi:hypothetical protein